MTDTLAAPTFNALNDEELAELLRSPEPLGRLCSKAIPYPNAMGVPAP